MRCCGGKWPINQSMTLRDRGDVSAGRGSLRTGAAGAGVDTRRNDGTVSGEMAADGPELGAAVKRCGSTGAVPAAAIGAARGGAEAFSSATGFEGGLGVGCVLANGGAVAGARGGGAVEASGGALTGAAVRGSADGSAGTVAGAAVRGVAVGIVRVAAGARVRRGAAGFADAVSPAALLGVAGTSAPGVGVARRRTGFAAAGAVGVASLVCADSAAGLRRRGGFGRSGSSMREV